MRQLLSEEEKKARKRERDKKYYQEHKDYYKEYHKEYNKEFYKCYQKEYHKEYQKEYNKTQKGRARFLVRDYKRNDKNANRGECTLTTQWIVDNIFTSKCHYCGEDDWHKLGCDRIDNKLPHTPENVVPCCFHCNYKKGRMNYDEYINLLLN